MLRRDFLARLAAGAGQAVHPAHPAPRHTVAAPPPKFERIAVSTWSLHNYFRATRRKDFTLSGPMISLLDFPDIIVDRYKIRHFEFCAVHFGSIEPAYVQEVKYALVRTRSTVVNMPLDSKECGPKGTFSDPDPDARKVALDALQRWVDVAHVLGAGSVRVGPGNVNPDDLTPTVESYRAIARYAQTKGIHVIIENHHDYGTVHPEEMLKLIKLVGPDRVGALPDFGNFPDEETRERGLKMFFPNAHVVCHTKGLEFDANGAETRYDFPKVVELAKKAGYRGVYSIEFDGPGDPYAGIQKTIDELLKYA